MDGHNEWGEETTAEREIKRRAKLPGARRSSTLLLSLLLRRQRRTARGMDG